MNIIDKNKLDLSLIADAIREKTGLTEKFHYEEIPLLIDVIDDNPLGDEVFDSIIGQTITSFNPADYEMTTIPSYFFDGCTELTDFNFANVSDIGHYAFRETGFTEIDMSKITLTTNTKYGVFAGSKVKKITCAIGGPKINWYLSANRMFEGCTELTEVENTIVFARGIDRVFSGCTSLTNYSVKGTIGFRTFESCGDFPTNASSAKIGDWAFADNLGTHFSATNVSTIGRNIFYGCSNLKTISIALGRDAASTNQTSFYPVFNLEEFYLTRASYNDSLKENIFLCFDYGTGTEPKKLHTVYLKNLIGDISFNSYPSLTSLILDVPTILPLANTTRLGGTPIADGTGHIYVPESLVEDYKIATNWAIYADQILPISEDMIVEVTEE